MIRILFIILSMVIYTATSVTAQSPGPIIIEEEAKCFVCGRTPADFIHLHKEALKAYQNQIQELLIKIGNINKQNSERYQRISNATRGNRNLALTIETVLTDPDTFKQMIPFLEEMLEYYENYGRRFNLGSSSSLRLSGIVESMKDPPLRELVQAKKDLEMLKVRLEIYKELSNSFIEFPLFRVTTKFSTISESCANIDDLKKQNDRALANIISSAQSSFKDTRSTYSIWEIIESAKKKIDDNQRIEDWEKTEVYNSFLAEFLEFGRIEYKFYLCPVCLTLFKNSVPSSKYLVQRFNKRTNRWDSSMHNFP